LLLILFEQERLITATHCNLLLLMFRFFTKLL